MCSHNLKDRKHIEQNYHSVARVIPRGGTWGSGGVKNLSVGICDGVPSTARSSSLFVVAFIVCVGVGPCSALWFLVYFLVNC